VKKLLALLLALALIAAACGSDEPDGTTTEPDDDTTEEPDDAMDDEPIEIEMWIAFGDDARLNYTIDRANSSRSQRCRNTVRLLQRRVRTDSVGARRRQST